MTTTDVKISDTREGPIGCLPEVCTTQYVLDSIYEYMDDCFGRYSPKEGFSLYLDGQRVVSVNTVNKAKILFRLSNDRTSTESLLDVSLDGLFGHRIVVLGTILQLDGRPKTNSN
jgi:hypothetical protein